MDGNKTVVLQKIQELIKKSVRSVVDETNKMVDIVVMKYPRTTGTVLEPHNIAGGAPEVEDTKEGTAGEAHTSKDLL